MSGTGGRGRARRIVLVTLLAVAALVLGAVIVVTAPILLHQSAGGSGRVVPDGFVAETSATGMDGRTRSLRALTLDGAPADLSSVSPGETLVVEGSGFDAGIGIYVAICEIPTSEEDRPSPCLGGIPEGAEQGQVDDSALSSAWVTNDWVWRSFATHRFAGDGSFTVELTVPEPVSEDLDCRETRCAIATRADHTAGSDRVQDMLLPIAYAG